MSLVAPTRFARFFLALSALLVVGCDGFVGSDPMDRHGSVELQVEQLLDHPTALGVLALVNDPAVTDVAFLDEGLGLDVRAAERIVAHRQGADGLDGTADDDIFGSIIELDEIGYVGETALLALGDAAWELDYVPAMVLEGIAFSAHDAAAVTLLGNEATLEQLDSLLDVRAAEAIVSGRPYHHLAEVAERPHVGPAALTALLAHTEEWL